MVDDGLRRIRGLEIREVAGRGEAWVKRKGIMMMMLMMIGKEKEGSVVLSRTQHLIKLSSYFRLLFFTQCWSPFLFLILLFFDDISPPGFPTIFFLTPLRVMLFIDMSGAELLPPFNRNNICNSRCNISSQLLPHRLLLLLLRSSLSWRCVAGAAWRICSCCWCMLWDWRHDSSHDSLFSCSLSLLSYLIFAWFMSCISIALRIGAIDPLQVPGWWSMDQIIVCSFLSVPLFSPLTLSLSLYLSLSLSLSLVPIIRLDLEQNSVSCHIIHHFPASSLSSSSDISPSQNCPSDSISFCSAVCSDHEDDNCSCFVFMKLSSVGW